MFADDKSIENMQQLFTEFKKYLELQKEYTKLEIIEKTSQTTLHSFISATAYYSRRSGSVSSVVYAGLCFSTIGRRAHDEFCTYHMFSHTTHRSACLFPQKTYYQSDNKVYR